MLKKQVKLIPFSSHHKGEWLPDGQTEVPVHRPLEEKQMQEEIESPTEQVSRKLKYLYPDHNARPHTFMKRPRERCHGSVSSDPLLAGPRPES